MEFIVLLWLYSFLSTFLPSIFNTAVTYDSTTITLICDVVLSPTTRVDLIMVKFGI